MRKLLISACIGLLAIPAFAGYLEENTRVLRVDVFADEDVFDEAVGWEVGFGGAVHKLDEFGIFGGMYENDGDDELKFAGIQIEENYPLRLGVVPFAGVAVGYSDLEVDDEDTDGIFGRLQGGVKLVLSDSITVAGTVRYWISSHENLIDGDRADDHRLDVSVGLRFHY
jgi:hypothetical protein